MIQDSQTDNKRIAKNTLVLYIRAFIMMAIGLFTSRILLQTLGVTDVGIYNAVGGIVSLFAFITSSLSNSTSRFISYDIGLGEQSRLNKTFANIKFIYYGLAILVFILGETIGLWFLYKYMVIPVERFSAALWVYHYSILSTMLGLVCIPYNAAIVAHERMSAFAYMSMFDVIYKLLIVYLLKIIPYDRLIVYSTFFFFAGIINRYIYAIYCKKRFEEVNVKPKIDKTQFKEIFTFSAWVIGGNLAWVANTHGLNLLLNIFGGPIVNAARSIALQVQGVISQFVTNFQTAVNPQITKTYARNELIRMHNLIIWSSKFSFYLLLILCLPIIFDTFFVLKIWLVTVPDYTNAFLKLVLISSLLKTFSNPIWTAVLATGNLRKYQLYDNVIQFMVLPTCYLILKFSSLSYSFVYVIIIIYELLLIPIRLNIVLPLINFSRINYFKEIIFPIILVSILAASISFIIYANIEKTFIGNTSIIISVFLTTIVTIWIFGLKRNERDFIIQKIKLLKNKRL